MTYDLKPGALEEVLTRLDEANEAGRAEIVNGLLGQGRLALFAGNGRRANLRGVSLGGARLRGADLREADLRGARLPGAFLAQADLRGAVLEGADLSQADLADADLRGAALGEVNLRGALLEETKLGGANLRFANLQGAALEGANLEDADAWGAVFENASLAGANLRGARVGEAFVRGADLSGADLRGTTLTKTDLSGATLAEAQLGGAILRGANLGGATLRGADLRGADLTSCDLTHTHIGDALLEKTRLRLEQLGGAVGEERAGNYDGAAQAYNVLERNFVDLGDPDAAVWAYLKKRRMQKRAVRAGARAAGRAGRWGAAIGGYARFAGDQLIEWSSDYGESIPRVLATLVAVYLLFTLLYGLTGSVVRVEGDQRVVTRNLLDLMVFSLLSMTTPPGLAVALVPRSESIHFLTAAQFLLVIFLTGLLGFVAGNRIRR